MLVSGAQKYQQADWCGNAELPEDYDNGHHEIHVNYHMDYPMSGVMRARLDHLCPSSFLDSVCPDEAC